MGKRRSLRMIEQAKRADTQRKLVGKVNQRRNRAWLSAQRTVVDIFSKKGTGQKVQETAQITAYELACRIMKDHPLPDDKEKEIDPEMVMSEVMDLVGEFRKHNSIPPYLQGIQPIKSIN